MRRRLPTLLLLTFPAAACAGAAPALEYGVPSPDEVRYVSDDTTSVRVSVMGQRMEMSQRATADYAVVFSPAPSGVNVTMSLTALDGVLTQPMGGPVQVDEGEVEGVLVFSLDREGNAVVTETPSVAVRASQMVSGLALAHGFFPGLPGRSAGVGDAWVDTVTFQGPEGAGTRSETSVLSYRVQGDTVVAGRRLLRLDVEGTTSSSAELAIAGMSVSQSSELETEGFVLWDPEAGLMVERHTSSTGRGTATVPVAPDPLPIRIDARQHVRLRRR